MRAKTFAAAAFVSAMALAPRAHAQDAAAAEALFQKGHDAFEAKRYAEACPAFAESYRLDPVSGSLLALASCYEADGKLASAWSKYNEVAALADREGKGDRAEAARGRARELEPKLARLTIAVAPDAASIAGLTVSRDGTQVGSPTFGTAIPVDRGEHTIEASAPGHAPFSQRITIQDGAALSVSIPSLSVAPGGEGIAQPPQVERSTTEGSPVRTAGWVAIAVGAAAVVGGGVFGGLAIAKKSESDAQGCDPDDRCDAVGKGLRQDARGLGNLSTAFVVAGGLVAATGIVLVVVGGSDKSAQSGPTASLAPAMIARGGGLSLTGRF